MKKRNRNLPLIVGGLAAIALGTVGFSSWIIGYQHKVDDAEDITVDVDATKLSVVDFKVTNVSNADLSLGENNKKLLEQGLGVGADEAFTPDFNIKIDVSLEITQTFLADKDVKSITIDWKKSSAENEKNHVITDTAKPAGRPVMGEYWTYIDITEASKSISTPVSYDSALKAEGWTGGDHVVGETYNLTRTLSIDFEWGTFFNNEDPTTFYNAGKSAHEGSEKEYFNNVKTELDTMLKTLKTESAKFELTASLITESKKAIA